MLLQALIELTTQVYNFTGTLPHGPTTPPPVGGGGGGGAPVFPASNLPAPWQYAACYV